ncbi:MAG: MopE-related protein [Myxococcota bacterium]|nr:MopE-related protein [Myxococcota bacterium]
MRNVIFVMAILMACRTDTKELVEDGLADPFDADGDGYSASEDCDDNNPSINASMPEICDGIDNNCDGNVDEGVTETWFTDADGDGFGNSNLVTESCGAEDGLSAVGGDCNDDDATAFPSNPEICDGVDNDCNGTIDENVGDEFFADLDADGYGDADNSAIACDTPDGFVDNDADCNDLNPEINPEGVESCDGLDNDCDGLTDEDGDSTWYIDNDGDGFGDSNISVMACDLPAGYAATSGDCDDSNPSNNPLADEFCLDGVDNDCDGQIDEADAADALVWFIDSDADGYGNSSQFTMGCTQPNGYVSNNTDCDDNQAAAFPSNNEICFDNIDNDCDGSTDDSTSIDASTWFIDNDSDGFGNSASAVVACEQPIGHVPDNSDCNDSNGLVNPSAVEVCNTIDDNCDGVADENTAIDAQTWYFDSDGDGFGNTNISEVSCSPSLNFVFNSSDCDDSNFFANPAQIEQLDNGVDDDCDGFELCYTDADNDGFVSLDLTQSTPSVDLDCNDDGEGTASQPAIDCDDANLNINPSIDETCGDGLDNNCDGLTDDSSSIDAAVWYADGDNDNFGDSTSTVLACAQPLGYVSDNTDCNDSEGASFPNNPEVCDSIDNDCNGAVDDGAFNTQLYYEDGDGDGFGDNSTVVETCSPPQDYVALGNDCDDNDNDINPNATEVCDGEDNNCDGLTDDSSSADALLWYVDADGDGFGDGTPAYSCVQPTGLVSIDGDCDDSDIHINPNGNEMWYDLLDSDCDGNLDPDPCVSLPGESTINADLTCAANYGSSANWTVQIEWQVNDIGYSTANNYNQVMMRPSVGQLTDDNGDGLVDEYDIPDIAFTTFSGGSYGSAGYLRVFSGDGSGEHYSLSNTGLGSIFSSSGVAIGDVDLDGYPDILTTLSNGKVVAMEGQTGQAKWASTVTVSGYTQMALYDVDGDGDVEVLADRYLLNGADGSLITDFGAGGYYQSIAEDVNRDGQLEIFTNGGLYTHQGDPLWSSGLGTGTSGVANFDNDPEGEIITRVNNVTYLLDDNGSIIWSRNISGFGNPCIADFDGDGQPEVGISSANTFTMLDTDGTTLWQQSTYDPSNGTMGCSAFDFEGDGYAEVVYSDRSNLWIFAGLTGNIIYRDTQPASGSLWEYSYVADVDNDGAAEIVLPSNNYSISGYRGVVVYGEANDSWASARTQHHQHAYNNAYITDNMEVISTNVGWEQLNGYRQQAAWSEQPNGAPDMGIYMLGACDSCNTNSTTVFVAIDNWGSVFVPEGTPIDVYAVSGNSDILLDTLVLDHRLDPGVRSAPLMLSVTQAEIGTDGLRFVIDGDNLNRECDEQNNSVTYTEAICP